VNDGAWCRRDAVWGASIFAVALALRLVTLFEIREIPSVETLIIDAASYDGWARRIAAGAWFGDTVFYQAPLYPYLMAVLYTLPGPDVWMLRIAQAGMGALSCAFVFATTRTLFGRSAGVAAGLFLAFYPPAIFFDGIVLKTSLGLLLTTALLLAIVTFQATRKLWIVGVAGLLLGLLALTRENALVLIPVVVVWLGLRFSDVSWTRRAASIALLALGLALPLGAVAGRNQVVGDTFALTTSQLGTNFFYGNNPGASGGYVPLLPGRHTPVFEAPDSRRLAEQALGRELTAGEVSDYWLGRGLTFVREQPVDWLRLTLRKWLFVWNDFEMPDTEDVYAYAEWSWVLRSTGFVLGFGVFAPLAAAGIALAWRRRAGFADSWILVALALVYAAGVTLFLMLARFRFPLVPLLLPFAGLALARFSAAVRQREWRPPLAPLLAFAAMALLAWLPLHDRRASLATSFLNYGSLELGRGALDEADRHLERAAYLAPNSQDILLHRAILRIRQDRLPQAEHLLRTMLAKHPPDARVHRQLALVLRRQGRLVEARQELQRARRLSEKSAVPVGSTGPEGP
jgi:tetratricopeptide (TPR) repeat protein